MNVCFKKDMLFFNKLCDYVNKLAYICMSKIKNNAVQSVVFFAGAKRIYMG